MLKNIDKSTILKLKDQISFQDGQIISKTLVQNSLVSITLFAFASGEEISTHESSGDALVTCLEGKGRITIDGISYALSENESIIMPANHPHAVFALENFKMSLIVTF